MDRFEFISQPKISRTEEYLDELGVRTIDFFVRGKGAEEMEQQFVETKSNLPARQNVREDEEEKNKDRGPIVGILNARIFSRPMPIISVTWVGTYAPATSQKITSMLMRTVEQKIFDEGALGILQDGLGIYGGPKEAIGMYKRHHWVVSGGKGGTMFFNMRDIGEQRAQLISDTIAGMYQVGSLHPSYS